ncbi:MAG: hypothetical protein HYV13_00395 [Candidatus Doudnabacteria bacterium]|nr:hypothetical protein [Candidatus Doudnabacteria bacterium]
MTIDDLATMVAKGFEQTATKQDLLNFVTKEDLKKEMQTLRDEIQALRNAVNSHFLSAESLLKAETTFWPALSGAEG